MKFKLIAACGVAASCLSTAAFAQTTPTPEAAAQAASASAQPAATEAVPATPGAAIAAQPLPQVATGSALPSNTDIWLTLDRKLDSHDVKVGDVLTFKVARDVMLGNYIVIPRGTPATGRVTLRSGRGAFG